MGLFSIFKRKPSYEEQRARALTLEKENDFLGAAEIWERIARQAPDSIDIYLRIAEKLDETGHKEKAIDWYYKAVLLTPENSPDCSEIERKYGKILMECGRYDDAEFQFIIAEDVDPTNWKVHFNRGELHEKQNENNSALGYYIDVYKNAKPGSSIWKQSKAKIEKFGAKLPAITTDKKTPVSDASLKTPSTAVEPNDHDAVEEVTKKILALPEKAFFLYVARILQRTINENALNSIAGHRPSEAITEIIESLSKEFERNAGISDVQAPYFDKPEDSGRFDKFNNFELRILTQFYNIRTGIVIIQTSDVTELEKIREAKLKILTACEMILVSCAQVFNWDYVPPALQSAWDMDTLVLLQRNNKLEQILQLGFDPFLALYSEKKEVDRLKNISSIGLSSIKERKDKVNEILQKSDTENELSSKRRTINVTTPSGDSFVYDCFDFGFKEMPDDRKWFEIAEIKNAQHFQWAEDTGQAISIMRKLISDYPDFDIVYSWTSEIYRRMGYSTKAIDVLN
ncbi:MAG: tetratricopeptide repeat protein [Draconibacterium sp.]